MDGVNNSMIPVQQAWLVGYLEGEGYFGGKGPRGLPVIGVTTTDHDTAEKVAFCLEAPVYGPYAPTGSLGQKVHYQVRISGLRALHWMVNLFSALSQHRRDQIIAALDRWEHVGLSRKGWNLRTGQRVYRP